MFRVQHTLQRICMHLYTFLFLCMHMLNKSLLLSKHIQPNMWFKPQGLFSSGAPVLFLKLMAAVDLFQNDSCIPEVHTKPRATGATRCLQSSQHATEATYIFTMEIQLQYINHEHKPWKKPSGQFMRMSVATVYATWWPCASTGLQAMHAPARCCWRGFLVGYWNIWKALSSKHFYAPLLSYANRTQ